MSVAGTLAGNYRIEVSGWGLNDAFFVEQTNLHWTGRGERKLMLHHALAESAVIFVRLMAPENSRGSVPVAYQVEGVQPMNSNGLCEMRLRRLHPRSKAHTWDPIASLSAEYSSNAYETKQSSIEPELEEVLHEA
jgi:hypothetical protein